MTRWHAIVQKIALCLVLSLSGPALILTEVA
jgi:hypothetical protein